MKPVQFKTWWITAEGFFLKDAIDSKELHISTEIISSPLIRRGIIGL